MKEAKGTLIMLAATVVVLIVIGFLMNPGISPFKLPAFTTQTQTTTGSGKKVVGIGNSQIEVTLAATTAKRSKGLSGVESLGENEGMLFVFEKENQTSPFWMKGMLIPIDIIWINDGKVSEITDSAQPPQAGIKDKDLKLFVPDDPYDYVLEVNAGFSQKNNIKVGDNVDLSKAL